MSRFSIASFVRTGLAAGAFALAPLADAAMPDVFSAVPTDAPLFIATPDIAQLDKDAGALMAVLGLPEMATPRQLLGGIGFSRGMNASGSAAMVVTGGLDTDEPKVAIFLPVSDYDAMVESFGAQRADGLDTLSIQGEQAFARRVGSYALISQDRAFAARYETADRMAEHATRLGTVGVDVAEASDIVVVADMASVAPLVERGMEQGGAQAQMALGQMGGGLEGVMKAMRDEMQVGVLGVQADAMGVGVDVAFTFKEGSEAKKMFDSAGRSSALLAAMPDRPFLLATALDMSHPGLKGVLEAMGEMQEQAAAMGGGMNPFGGMGGMGGGEMFANATGSATVIYPNPAGPMMGMLANMVQYYEAKDPEAMVASTRDSFKGMAKAMQGLSFTYNEDVAQVDGVSVDEWQISMAGGGDMMAMQMMQASQMMFGSASPSGYIAQSDGGVFQTYTKNTALLREALVAAKGQGAGLAGDPSIKAIAARLPGDLAAEGYISVRTLLDSVGPMAQMLLGARLDAPADLPPVGGGLVGDDGALRLAGYVPAPVLKLGADIAQQIQQRQQQGGGQRRGPAF